LDVATHNGNAMGPTDLGTKGLSPRNRRERTLAREEVVFMPHAVCAHCGVQIIDHSTMVERDGKTYCCGNCAATHEGPEKPG